jgi:protein-S-isoprenylcysteine O-methyltransferase Ste14
MLASDFEFRHRTWFIFGIFFVGLACYWFDPQNSGEVLARTLRSRVGFLQQHSLQNSIRGLFLTASIVVATGAMIRTWGAAYLHADVVHDSSLRSERLVADGPFRYTRNPIYFGSLIGVFGAGLLFSRTGWVLQTTIAMVFCYRLIFREERELFRTQDEGFAAYCQAVPRLLPSLRPRVPSSGATPHWRKTVAGQTPWWGVVAAEIVYAVTLRLSLAIWIALAAFLTFVAQKYLLKLYARPVAVTKETR